MTDVRVTSVNRQPGNKAYDGITHLSGPQWRWTRDQVVNSIQAGRNTFFVLEHGHRADLAVVTGPEGLHLRTRADGHWTDDLLELPECRNHEGSVAAG